MLSGFTSSFSPWLLTNSDGVSRLEIEVEREFRVGFARIHDTGVEFSAEVRDTDFDRTMAMDGGIDKSYVALVFGGD